MVKNRIVVVIIAIVMLLMTVPPFMPDVSEVSGGSVTKDSNGDLIVDGATHTIDMNGAYQQEGNITIMNAGGKLIIRDTVFNFLTPNFQRNIWIKDGGQLILDNATITVNLDTFNFKEGLLIDIKSNGILDMESSSIECDGWLNVSGGKVYARNSTITANSDDGGLFKTCVDINLVGASYMALYDSEIKALPENGYMEIGGTSTFLAVNTYIDIDFESQKFSRLKASDSAKIYLYGVTTVEPGSYPPASSAIKVPGSDARVEIYKWARLFVVDSAGIPVGGAFVTAKNFTVSEPVKVPRIEILNYLGKTSTNWNKSGIDGLSYFPLRTNILTYGATDPISNYTGTYNLTAILPAYDGAMAAGGVSFSSYPRMLTGENTIKSNVSYEEDVIPPWLNEHYSTEAPLVITGNMVFKSPIQLQQNILIKGGSLTLDSTNMNFAQTADDRYYILINESGSLMLNNAKISDKSNIRFNIYSYGSTVNLTDALLDDIGVLVARDGGEINLVNTQLNGNFNVMSNMAVISVTDNSFFNSSIVVMDYAEVTITDSVVNASSMLSVADITLTAINTDFSRALEFNGTTTAELINVAIDDKVKPIVIMDDAVVNRGWWLTVNVTDGGSNPVMGVLVDLYNYSLPNGDLVKYDNATTDMYGQVVMKVIGEVMTATKTYTGLERSYYIESTYKTLKSESSGFTPPTANLKKIIAFSEKPELKPTDLQISGQQIEGKQLTFNITIENNGDFQASNINVRFLIGGEAICPDKTISYIANGSKAYLEADWEAKLGSYTLEIMVDPDNKIGEDLEDNNEYETVIDISVGSPDIYVYSITFNPDMPQLYETINVTIDVGNAGESDPSNFNNLVTIEIYLGDPDEGGELLGTKTIDSIKPENFKQVYIELTFNVTGEYTIYATVATALDSELTNNKLSESIEVFNFADLTLKKSSIVFLPTPEVAKGADVTIEATIQNLGESYAFSVDVEFYEGMPGAENEPFGTKEIDVPPNSNTAVASQIYKPTTTGYHNIYVVVDRINATRELNETNNMANNTLRVLKEPDLSVDPDLIRFISIEPSHIIQDELITINATIENLGETTAWSFWVYFSYKSTSNVIGTKLINRLDPGAETGIEITWAPPDEGSPRIFVTADKGNLIEETNEDNNEVTKAVRVYSKPDLTMDPEDLFTDITGTPKVVPYSKEVSITATVRNRGESNASAFYVQLFDGDPSKGGEQIDVNKYISGINSGESKTVNIKWSAKPWGDHTIYFIIDAYNEIGERDETNNYETIAIYVETVPDLKVTKDDIEIKEGDYGRIGEPININITIHNDGDTDSNKFGINIYNGDPIHDTTTPTLISTRQHSGIIGGEMDHITLSWTPSSFGHYKIFVWVDEAETIFELSDVNNYAGREFEVLQIAPDLSLAEDPVAVMVGETEATEIKTKTAYDFVVTVSNVGNENISESHISISYLINEVSVELVVDGEVSGVEEGETTTFTTKWTPPYAGEYTFTISLDSMEEHREFNESNDFPVKKNVITKPDLKISDKSKDIIIKLDGVKTDRVNVGDEIEISVTVTVTGTITEMIFMDFYVNGVKQTTQYSALASEGKAEYLLKYKVESEGSHQFKFILDPDNDIDEDREAADNEAIDSTLYVAGGKAAADDKEGGLSTMLLLVIIIIIIVVIIVVLLVVKRRKGKKPVECPECGADVPAGETECPECGAEIAEEPELIECSKCGAELTTEDETCPECGEPNENFEPPEAEAGAEPEEEAPPGQPPTAAAAAPAPAPAPAPPKKAKKKKKSPAAGPAPVPPPAPAAAAGAPPGMPGAPAPAPAPAPAGAPGGGLEGLDDILEEGEGEAECYKCGARVPLSVPKCPVCGADFE